MLEDPRWKRLHEAAERRRADVLTHPLYGALDSLDALRIFMEHHVWAVWDFMSLLTRLQRDVTCTTVPWVPNPHGAAVARFVNEIKLGEESDDVGVPTSHLELYRSAMVSVGADTSALDAALAALAYRPSADVPGLMAACGAPSGAVRFTTNTMRTAQRAELVEVAAAFALGREQLIPDLFRPLLEGHPECALLDLYLRRHIDLDEGEHGPAAHRLVAALCGDVEGSWLAAEHAVAGAIEARHRLWSDTLAVIAR